MCPNGDSPRTARYPTRGDFILMKGSAFNVDSNRTKTSTIYTYRKHERENDKPRYECVSDHALLTFASDKAILSNCKWIRSSNSEEICFIFLWYLHCVQQTNKASKHKHNAWVFSPRRRTCFYTLILARMCMHQIIMVAGPFALNPPYLSCTHGCFDTIQDDTPYDSRRRVWRSKEGSIWEL